MKNNRNVSASWKKLLSILLLFFFSSTSYAVTSFISILTIGGTEADFARSVADKQGNIFIAGGFQGTVDFNPSASEVDNKASIGSWDIFLTKINSDGSYAYTKTIGGLGADSVAFIAVDSLGNIIVGGSFQGIVDFDPSISVDTHISLSTSVTNSHNAFFTKINADGSYGWTNSLRGSGDAVINTLSIDANDNIITSGVFSGTIDFDSTTGIDSRTSIGKQDGFYSKLNADGIYAWTNIIGSSGNEGSEAIIDKLGRLIVTGHFQNTLDFDPGVATDTHSATLIPEINASVSEYFTVFNPDGSYGWTKTFPHFAGKLGIDLFGNFYLGGNFYGTVDFNPDAGIDIRSSTGNKDIFLTKINTDGSYAWTINIGGTGVDQVNVILADDNGGIFVGGSYQNIVDFNPGVGVDERAAIGFNEMFLMKFDSSGEYKWAETFGGSDISSGGVPIDIFKDVFGNLVVSGVFHGIVDFDLSSGVNRRLSLGSNDIFLTKVSIDLSAQNSGGIFNTVCLLILILYSFFYQRRSLYY